MDAGERAAAKPDRADGADGLFVGKADVGAVGFFVDGHLGNDGYTDSGSHHAEQAGELTTFKDNPWMESRAITCGDGVFAETVAVA